MLDKIKNLVQVFLETYSGAKINLNTESKFYGSRKFFRFEASPYTEAGDPNVEQAVLVFSLQAQDLEEFEKFLIQINKTVKPNESKG